MSQPLFDVAAYILDNHGAMTTMKLHTLLYCCQAKQLVTHDTALFDNDFHAWRHTPVNIDLFTTHRHGPMIIHADDDCVANWHACPSLLSEAARNTIDNICTALMPYTRVQLCSQIMTQPPFIDALARSLSHDPRDGGVIDTKLMCTYYRDHPIINLSNLEES